MQQLPDLTGLKSEVIIPKSSRNAYDHAVRMRLKTVEVDSMEEPQGGHRPGDGADHDPGNRFEKVKLGLEEVAPIAKRPAFRCSSTPPRLPWFPIPPPPAPIWSAARAARSRAGRRRPACCWAARTGPRRLGELAPHHAFGRPMKVSKEEIVGMVTAVDVWVNKRDLQAEIKEWKAGTSTSPPA